MTNLFSTRGGACAILFAALTVVAPATQAATLTYNYEGPAFTDFSDTTSSANFVPGDRVTGFVSFDDSLLTSGSGSVESSSGSINTGLTWSFEDGHNLFNNTNTTTNFTIQLSFSAFEVSSWYIDTTFGVTDQADIFETSSEKFDFGVSSVSWFEGERASGSVSCDNNDRDACQPWSRQVSAVPLPAGFPLMLAGLGAFYWLRRRQA